MKRSWVRSYILVNDSDHTAVCQVSVAENEKCGKKLVFGGKHGTGAVCNHLKSEHQLDPPEKTEGNANNNRLITSMFSPKKKPRLSENEDLSRIVLALAMNNISYSALDCPFFREAFNIPSMFNRKRISLETIKTSEEVTKHMMLFLKHQMVTLGVDGWTNCRHDKLLNVLALFSGKVFVFLMT
eukprot:GCRY01002574.1.p2 GENE.GCRY01002574.1~~GCRY01002574.1.p2  ORF type:complete len:184 (-),score=23.49 GCRY01002574.1:1925-2476(-)